MSSHKTDVVIIGAGPVGLFAIFELGMLKINAHVIDTLPFVGGQCSALYPEKPIYDVAGFPDIEAQTLIDNLEKQASPFNPTYHLDQQVIGLEKTSDGFSITTSKNTKIECKAVIIAAGCGAFGPNRPPLDGIESYEGGAVNYMVRRKRDLEGKNVVIAGGGDSALDWAIDLHDIAAKVSVVHRRPKFRAAPESVDKLHKLADAGKIDLVIPYQLHGLKGDGKSLDAVEVATLDGEVKAIEADVLLPFFGLSMELGPIAEWGLNIDKKHITANPQTLETSEPGIYGIGDIIDYPGKLKLIVCGFSEAAMAAHAIYPLIYPDTALHFEYSTSKGVSGA